MFGGTYFGGAPFGAPAFIVVTAGATLVFYGKYKPEHDGALADLKAATGFGSDHAGAFAALRDAG